MHKFNNNNLNNIKKNFDEKAKTNISTSTDNFDYESKESFFSLGAVAGFAALALIVGITANNIFKNNDNSVSKSTTETALKLVQEEVIDENVSDVEDYEKYAAVEISTEELNTEESLPPEITEDTNTSTEELPIIQENNTEDIPQSWPNDYCYPTDTYCITSEEYADSTYNICFASPKDSLVYAVYSGIVLETGYADTLGNYIKIKNDDGAMITYGHLGSISCSNNDKVSKGSTIGTVGANCNLAAPAVVIYIN